METPKKPNDTTKASQTSMGLSLRPSNPDDYPISYADDSWDATEQNSKLSEILEGWGQYDQHTINEALAGRLLAMYAELDERIKRLEGFHYMITGTALQGTIVIEYNGEQIAAVVGADNTFEIKYKEPIQTLEFEGADIVSVSFYDCDSLIGLTSCDDMFKNCVELVAVDFANKSFASVLSAVDMFDGCTALTTLICPETGNWKPNLDFSDCPDLTAQSLEDLIVNFLYTYTSGVHTIKPNDTMWGSLTPSVQNSLESLANAKGWQIDITRFTLLGTSGGNSVTFTINGTSVTVPVTSGAWNYQYNVPITSISFANDTDVVDIDFSLSDGLAGVTSLNEAFKGCVGLTTVDFTNCDLSNVASATDAFLNCSALYSLEIPTGTWEPDLNLESSVMPKTEMLNVIDGLYTYSSGTHTVTFNSTMWDAMSVADQQAVFDAADAKGWTTNAVAIIWRVSGKSTNVNGTETIYIQFIDEGAQSPSARETITCIVDSNGNWYFDYTQKRIYSILQSFIGNTTITEIDFSASDGLESLTSANLAFSGASSLAKINFTNCPLNNVTDIGGMFYNCTALSTIVGSENITFKNVLSANHVQGPSNYGCFTYCTSLTSLDLRSATFEKATNVTFLLAQNSNLATIDLSSATFEKATTFGGIISNCPQLTTISLPNATFDEATSWIITPFNGDTNLTTLSMPKATFKYLQVGNIFKGLSKLKNLDLTAVTFERVTDASQMFEGCSLLENITWGNSLNFAELLTMGTSGHNMFLNCSKLTNASVAAMNNQTFPKVTQIINMFFGCSSLTKIDWHSATFANLTDCGAAFYGLTNLTEIDLSAATFAKVTSTKLQTFNAFYGLTSLTTLNVPQNSTAILPTSTPANAPIDLSYCPLSYASMLKVANWLSDLTGYTQHTVTFNATAWGNLSTAEQNNIDTILSGKNWTRTIL